MVFRNPMKKQFSVLLILGVIAASVALITGFIGGWNRWFPRADHTLIQGRWKLVASTDNGMAARAGELSLRHFVFDQDTMWVQENENSQESFPFRLHPEQSPKWIDTVHGERVLKGIYRINGNTLTVCINERRGARPTAFLSEADSPNDLLMVFKRD